MTTQNTLTAPAQASNLQILRHLGLRELAASTVIVALMAQIVIPLKPIPVTGQTLAVVLVGLLAHRKNAAGALTAYAVLAALGAPILSAGTSGIGASFGFVLGFIASAYIIARLSENGLSGWRTVAVPALGLAIPYVPGLIWLSGFLAMNSTFSFATLFSVGLLPFLLGDAIKLIIASAFAALIFGKK